MDLAKLFENERRSLMRGIVRIVRDAAAAEDLTQETFVRVQAAVAAGHVQKVDAFLRRTARNLAIDHQRQVTARGTTDFTSVGNSVVVDIADPRPSPETEIIDRNKLRALRQAMERLPARAQRILVLSRLEGLSQEQIANQLGISQRTVFNDLKMALARCSSAMRRHDGESR